MPHHVRPEHARSGGDVDERALGVGRALGDHVDHAVDRIRAPDAAAGSAGDLDAVDIGDDDVLRFPEHAGEDRGVDGAPVDQDQHLVGGADRKAARG